MLKFVCAIVLVFGANIAGINCFPLEMGTRMTTEPLAVTCCAVSIAQDDTPIEGEYADFGDLVYSLALSPDGKMLATGGRDALNFSDGGYGLKLFDLGKRQPIKSLPAGGYVWSVVFSPDNKFLISGSDQGLQVWDLQNFQVLATLKPDNDLEPREIRFVAISPSGKLLGASHLNATEIWDFEAKKLLRSFRAGGESAVAFSPDESILATAEGHNRVHLWDVATGNQLAEVHAEMGMLKAVKFSPDGKWIVASGENQTKVWQIVKEGDNLALEQRAVFAGGPDLDISSDGKLLATGGWNGHVYVYDLGTSKLLKKFPAAVPGSIHGVRFTPHAEYLVCAGAKGGGLIVIRHVAKLLEN